MLFERQSHTLRRLLIVEDEPLVAFDNEHVLTDAGYQVVATVDGVAEVRPDPRGHSAPPFVGVWVGGRGEKRSSTSQRPAAATAAPASDARSSQPGGVSRKIIRLVL